jgi:ATP-dependent Clp protease protease subunit
MENKTIKNFRSFYKSQNPFKMTSFDDKLHKMSEARGGYINPYILEESERNMSQLDIFSKLMSKRQIFFGTDVNSDSANIVVSQLLYLDSVENADITMYVNSPGGSCSSGAGIIDSMEFIDSDVRTINTGLCASYGAMILMCGTKGKRSALRRSRTMIHQPLIGQLSGQTTDIIIEAKEMERLRKELYETIVEQTGQTYETVADACERDNWMTAQEALDFGIIDEVIRKK